MHVHHRSFWPVVYLWALVCTFSHVNNIDLSLPTVRPGMLLPLGLVCGNTALQWRLPKSDPLQAVCLVLAITGKESNAINLYYISILLLYLKFHTRVHVENVCTSDVPEYEIFTRFITPLVTVQYLFIAH